MLALYSLKDIISAGYLLHKLLLKGTHREKAPSNKTPTLSKSMNMDIWVVGT